jgi:hypothetical protein
MWEKAILICPLTIPRSVWGAEENVENPPMNGQYLNDVWFLVYLMTLFQLTEGGRMKVENGHE